jgi:eukaryotic-like serine/threonine-protein kinase
MATGKVPFDADNLMGILTKHLYETPIAPHEMAPPVDVAPAMEAVILKCLQKKPEHRYQSMAELGADLNAMERGITPRAVIDKVERSTSGPQTLTGVEARVSVATGQIQIRKNRTPMFIGLGLAAAAVIGVGAFMMSGKDDGAQQPTAAVKPAEDPTSGAQPTAAPPPTAPAPAMVTVTSYPANAEVYQGGALVGNSPYALTKPESGKDVKLELRMPGYDSKFVTISSATGTAVGVNLLKKAEDRPKVEEPAVKAPPAGARKPPKKQNTEERPKPAPGGGKTKTQTEVLDPWD